MLAHFHAHQAALDEIIRMWQADPRLERVDYDWTQPDDPQEIDVAPTRVATYRRLLDSAGVHRGFEAWAGADEVDFLYWLQGSAITSDKGFAYLPQPPAHTLDSLDNCGPHGDNIMKAYRHIAGYWNLYYDDIPG